MGAVWSDAEKDLLSMPFWNSCGGQRGEQPQSSVELSFKRNRHTESLPHGPLLLLFRVDNWEVILQNCFSLFKEIFVPGARLINAKITRFHIPA